MILEEFTLPGNEAMRAATRLQKEIERQTGRLTDPISTALRRG
jgi:hypothetical protein